MLKRETAVDILPRGDPPQASFLSMMAYGAKNICLSFFWSSDRDLAGLDLAVATSRLRLPAHCKYDRLSEICSSFFVRLIGFAV